VSGSPATLPGMAECNETTGKTPHPLAVTRKELGEYAVVVKVIDILGNDTTKTVKLKVK
jgi:hypothetical protein